MTRDDAALLASDRAIGPSHEPTAPEAAPGLSALQDRLFALEQALIPANTPVAVIFEGWAGADKVRMLAALTRKLDPRGMRVYPISPPRTSEQRFPWLFRFWLKIPRYGEIALFDRSWYRQLLARRVEQGPDDPEWLRQCADACAFERMLIDDGTLVIKFWLHLSRDDQARRFKKLLADPLTSHRVTEEDLQQQRQYKKYSAAVDDLLARTAHPRAPWHRIDAAEKGAARRAVLQTVVDQLERHLALQSAPTAVSADDSSAALRRQRLAVQTAGFVPSGNVEHAPDQQLLERGILRHVRLDLRIDEEIYNRELKRLQARLYLLGLEVYRRQCPVVIVFEGWDAAGKGGAIQRLTAELDPRSYVVHAIAAPTGEDRARHYLYRFWRRLPTQGQIAIFDRSWFGRVLVERVEGFARPDEWRRAYDEINVFERQLTDFGTVLLKFWLHLSPEEQLRRFEARRTVPYKAWKLTDEDWRNREKWPHYEAAADEMLLRTDAPHAPWLVVEAEDKRFARIKVLQEVVDRLEAALGPVQLPERRRTT